MFQVFDRKFRSDNSHPSAKRWLGVVHCERCRRSTARRRESLSPYLSVDTERVYMGARHHARKATNASSYGFGVRVTLRAPEIETAKMKRRSRRIPKHGRAVVRSEGVEFHN